MVSPLSEQASEADRIPDSESPRLARIGGINIVLNRERLADYITRFGEDRDIRDLLILDVLANAAGLPISSTGEPENMPSLSLRPFRIWEYSWLYKTLRLSRGGATVLELGGPATHLTLLAATAGCQITTIDINARFVEAAQECASALQLPNFVSRVGDMRNLSAFADETFDVIVSCSVLEHLTREDQATAMIEAARVLKPGGIIGLTFDYGPPAPGANVYLPPPHDPPTTASEAIRRYAQGGLVVVGNAFIEDPAPGSLFCDDVVQYTIASLFLAKPPAPEVRVPEPQVAGTALGRLRISELPSRIQRHTAARNTEEAIKRAQSDTADEGERRAGEVEKLTAWLKERDLRIAELEQAAAERLDAVQRAEVVYRDMATEAERRAADVEKLTAWLKERDLRIAESEHAAAERLDALQRAEVIYRDIAKEAEHRLADVEKLTAWLKERDLRIAELEHTAAERLDALQRGDEIVKSLGMESAILRRDLEESEAERLRNAAALTAFEDETLLHFCARRLKKRSP